MNTCSASHPPYLATGLVLSLETPEPHSGHEQLLSQSPKVQKDKRMKWTWSSCHPPSLSSSASGKLLLGGKTTKTAMRLPILKAWSPLQEGENSADFLLEIYPTKSHSCSQDCWMHMAHDSENWKKLKVYQQATGSLMGSPTLMEYFKWLKKNTPIWTDIHSTFHHCEKKLPNNIHSRAIF